MYCHDQNKVPVRLSWSHQNNKKDWLAKYCRWDLLTVLARPTTRPDLLPAGCVGLRQIRPIPAILDLQYNERMQFLRIRRQFIVLIKRPLRFQLK